MEYISLTGNDEAANTRVISDIARYFSTELNYNIPTNYPFAGKYFNATSAGLHVDGLAKNQEIYNIFDTELILGRSVPISITDKSGRAGVAYWLNHELNLSGDKIVQKSHPAVGKIYDRITAAYERGRTTSISTTEMMKLARRFMPELFISDFTRLKQIAKELAASLVTRLASECKLVGPGIENYPWMIEAEREYPFLQYFHLTDANGKLLAAAISDPAYKERYDALPMGYDFSNREWFKEAMKCGCLHVTDLYQSHFTDKLILTVSIPVTDDNDNIAGILAADIQLEELLQHGEGLLVPDEDHA